MNHNNNNMCRFDQFEPPQSIDIMKMFRQHNKNPTNPKSEYIDKTTNSKK